MSTFANIQFPNKNVNICKEADEASKEYDIKYDIKQCAAFLATRCLIFCRLMHSHISLVIFSIFLLYFLSYIFFVVQKIFDFERMRRALWKLWNVYFSETALPAGEGECLKCIIWLDIGVGLQSINITGCIFTLV